MSASIVSRCQIREGTILCKVEHVIHGNKDTQMKYRPCRFYWPIESNKSYSPEMQQCPCVMYPIPTWPLDNESNDDQASRNEWHGGIRITFTCNKEWIRCFSPHTKEDDLTLFQIQKLKKVEKRFDPFHFSSLSLSLPHLLSLAFTSFSHHVIRSVRQWSWMWANKPNGRSYEAVSPRSVTPTSTLLTLYIGNRADRSL